MSPSGAPLPAAVESYLAWLRVERGRATSTLEAYRRDLSDYVAALSDRGTDVTHASADDLVDYFDGLKRRGLAPATRARRTSAVRSMHRHLAAEGATGSDPGVRIETPRVPSALPKALAEAEVARVIDGVVGERPVDVRDRALLEVLYGTGARVGEVVGLGLADVDIDGRLVRLLGKGSKERIVPLGAGARRALELWLDPGGRPAMAPKRWRSRSDADAVFLNQRGGRLTRQGVWLVLEGRASLVGLAEVMSPHVLRHSCATHMLDHGADIRAVQDLLGHASISTTQTYTKVATERLFAAYRSAHPRAEMRSLVS